MNQEILGNFCGTSFFEKVFSNLVKLQKNDRGNQNWQISTNEIAN